MTGMMATRANAASSAIDLSEKTPLVLVSVFRVVPAWMWMHEGGATPMNVPSMKGARGYSINGEARLMNQLGTMGVQRRNTM